MAEAAGGTRQRSRASSSATRRLTSGLRRPEVAPLLTLTAGVTGAAHLYDTNPHESGHWLPRCPFRLVTGALCPACGGTRMVYDLMHGQFSAAWHDNRLLLLTSPFALVLLARWASEGLRGRHWHPTLSGRAQAVVLVVAVAWTLARNLR